ncbi:hypothetical protein HOY80DRAFT_1087256 [Tuber brumale]|nr:hypothetical protein HOY80DRAFT_1087256 [Tuber brumale]
MVRTTQSTVPLDPGSSNYLPLIPSPSPPLFPSSQSKFASRYASESQFQDSDLSSASRTTSYISSPTSSQISLSHSLHSLSSSSQSNTSSTSESTQAEQDATPPSFSHGQLGTNSWLHFQLCSRHEVSTLMASKICALHHLAGLSYRSIAAKTHISLPTVYRIGHLPSTPPHKSRSGRPFILRSVERKKLIALASSTASNCRKPLTEIAFLAGIQGSSQTLQRSFAYEGYHRHVAQNKPFLSPKSKAVGFYFLPYLLFHYHNLVLFFFTVLVFIFLHLY